MKKILFTGLSVLTLITSNNYAKSPEEINSLVANALHNKTLAVDPADLEQFKEIIAKHKNLLSSLDKLPLTTQLSLLNFLEGSQVSTIMSLRSSLQIGRAHV